MRLFRMMNVVDVQCCGYYNDFLMNVFNIVIALMVQCRRFGANISMDVFAIMNVFNPQHRVCYDDYLMDVFNIVTALVVQRRSFGANISMDVFTIENVTTMQRRRFYAGIPMIIFAIMNVFNPQHRVFYDDYSMNVFDIVNALMVQRRRFGANLSMDVFAIENVTTMQRRWFYADIPMNVYSIINALMVQRRRCCSFDSPGLARNEPTPGQRSQGDSTPSVLSFFCEGTLTMKHFMTDYTKKPQHLWRCSPHNICYPRVACTIVWQPRAIKSATPMALKHLFYDIINANIRINKWQNMSIFQ